MSCYSFALSVFRTRLRSRGILVHDNPWKDGRQLRRWFNAEKKVEEPSIIDIGIGTERSGREFVTEEELAMLEKERLRTSVKYPKPNMTPPKKETEHRIDVEKNFSDRYLENKGVTSAPFSTDGDKIGIGTVRRRGDEMDPAILNEISKWNFISSQEDEKTKAMAIASEMATTIRLKELAECGE